MSEEPELTPEIAAKLFARKTLGQPEPEPEVEGLPPRDKPVSEWSEEEAMAYAKEHTRRMTELEERKQREAREHEARIRAEAMRTPEERHNDSVLGMLGAARKRLATEALLRSIHGK